jgi:hypothetical protein
VLTATVTDDGVGGIGAAATETGGIGAAATETGGTAPSIRPTGSGSAGSGSGLAGIERRMAAFGGVLRIDSPAGGPSRITVAVPCALS